MNDMVGSNEVDGSGNVNVANSQTLLWRDSRTTCCNRVVHPEGLIDDRIQVFHLSESRMRDFSLGLFINRGEGIS